MSEILLPGIQQEANRRSAEISQNSTELFRQGKAAEAMIELALITSIQGRVRFAANLATKLSQVLDSLRQDGLNIPQFGQNGHDYQAALTIPTETTPHVVAPPEAGARVDLSTNPREFSESEKIVMEKYLRKNPQTGVLEYLFPGDIIDEDIRQKAAAGEDISQLQKERSRLTEQVNRARNKGLEKILEHLENPDSLTPEIDNWLQQLKQIYPAIRYEEISDFILKRVNLTSEQYQRLSLTNPATPRRESPPPILPIRTASTRPAEDQAGSKATPTERVLGALNVVGRQKAIIEAFIARDEHGELKYLDSQTQIAEAAYTDLLAPELFTTAQARKSRVHEMAGNISQQRDQFIIKYRRYLDNPAIEVSPNFLDLIQRMRASSKTPNGAQLDDEQIINQVLLRFRLGNRQTANVKKN